MLDFNHNHKQANLSTIFQKIKKTVREYGHYIAAGTVSAVALGFAINMALFSGSSVDVEKARQETIDCSVILPGTNQFIEIEDYWNNFGGLGYILKDGGKLSLDHNDERVMIFDGTKDFINELNDVIINKNENNIIVNENEDSKIAEAYGLVSFENIKFIVELSKISNSRAAAIYTLEDGTEISVNLNNVMILKNPTQESLNMFKKIALSDDEITATLTNDTLFFPVNDETLEIPVLSVNSSSYFKYVTIEDYSDFVISENKILEYNLGRSR